MPTRPRQFHKFRKANIEALPPDAVGTYGLYSGDICIYIGSGNLRARLLAHRQGDNYCIKLHRPRRWAEFEAEDPEFEAARLILELNPRCNARVDTPVNVQAQVDVKVPVDRRRTSR